MKFSHLLGKSTSRRRGLLLIESAMSLSILTVFSLILLKLSMNLLYPRQWTMMQTLTDAYMGFEVASAQRIPFQVMNGEIAPTRATDPFWSNSTLGAPAGLPVVIGNLPRPFGAAAVGLGAPLNASVTRVRFADPNNLPVAGGTGTAASNPAEVEIWRLQSVLGYNVSGRNYVKSRTVIRSE